MKILVANLGSTSFKYRLFDMADPAEPVLARGVDRADRVANRQGRDQIGPGPARAGLPDRRPRRGRAALPRPVDRPRDRRAGRCGRGLGDRFQGGPREGPHRRACRGRAGAGGDGSLRGRRPRAQSALHQGDADAPRPVPRICRWSPPSRPGSIGRSRRRTSGYAIPDDWATELGIRRWGFHGASHRYIAGRMAELLGRDDLKVISCHLGGSSSLCAIRNGQSVACSLGMSPQSGLPHNNRVGDFDVFALPVILRETGMSLDEVLDILANESGLEGLSGAGCDLRDIEAAAEAGNERAEAGSGRLHRLGPPLPRGLPRSSSAAPMRSSSPAASARTRRRSARASVATSTGSASRSTRRQRLGPGRTPRLHGGSRVQVWTVPTNEEIVVARQAKES